jgi:glycosyltransferase involved in cell wall biosynthesis
MRNAALWVITGRPMYTIWHYEPAMQRMINTLLRTEHFDLVHVNDIAAACYDLPTEIPTIFIENEVRAPRPVDWRGWIRRAPYRGLLNEIDWHRWPMYQHRAWRQFDRVEVFTERDARIVRNRAPDIASRVRVNPFGIDMPATVDSSHIDEGTILFVGSFLHGPNIDAARWLVLDIMPLLRERYPGVRLTIVGSDPSNTVRDLARDDVEIRGWVPEIEPVLARAAVVIAPIRIGGGQRAKVLQAMSMGKAVVTTPRGAEGLVEDGCDPLPLACGNTAEALADLTASLLRDVDAREALSQRARAVALDRFDVSAYGRRLDDAYMELYERQPATEEPPT